MDKEQLDEQIAWAEKDLKDLKRKQRKDLGIKRTKYNSTLPPMYKRYLSSANKSGRRFELSVEEFNLITSHDCVYCGSSAGVGIDRRDNSDGYTLDNSFPCCTKCNMMKHKHSHEDFLIHIKRVYKFNFDK